MNPKKDPLKNLAAMAPPERSFIFADHFGVPPKIPCGSGIVKDPVGFHVHLHGFHKELCYPLIPLPWFHHPYFFVYGDARHPKNISLSLWTSYFLGKAV